MLILRFHDNTPAYRLIIRPMHYLIIERFRAGNPTAIYDRLRAQGRLAPAGLTYVSSWVTKDLKTCYQVMETEERSLLDEWMKNWEDLVEFEVMEVMSSMEARATVEKQQEVNSGNGSSEGHL
jgi:hypothetical protein